MKSLSTLESLTWPDSAQLRAGQNWRRSGPDFCPHGRSEATLSLEEPGVREEGQGLVWQEELGAGKSLLARSTERCGPLPGSEFPAAIHKDAFYLQLFVFPTSNPGIDLHPDIWSCHLPVADHQTSTRLTSS